MRDDVSEQLVHFTRGKSNRKEDHRVESFATLQKILQDGYLKGGKGYIRGGFECICFSEAPVTKFPDIFVDNVYKYQPYGIICQKRWIFEKGGRPVIYGTDDEYELLHVDLKYRFVLMDLREMNGVDFSWEREWRFKSDRLYITPEEVTVVVPDRKTKVLFEEDGFGHWHFLVLSDLGITIEPI